MARKLGRGKAGMKKLKERILFTDECPAKTGQTNNRHNQGARISSPSREPIMFRTRTVGIAFNIGAGISMHNMTDLKLYQAGDNINGTKYCDLLQFYKKEGQKCFPNRLKNSWVVMEDGAKSHTSRVANKKRKELKLRPLMPHPDQPYTDELRFFWPGNSPDLNPIENLWAELKRRIGLENPRTCQDVKRLLTPTWNKMRQEKFYVKFFKGWEDRLQKVIDSKGGSTGK